MNRKTLLCPITTILADFLFGFDIVVISGAKKNYNFYGTLHVGSMVPRALEFL